MHASKTVFHLWVLQVGPALTTSFRVSGFDGARDAMGRSRHRPLTSPTNGTSGMWALSPGGHCLASGLYLTRILKIYLIAECRTRSRDAVIDPTSKLVGAVGVGACGALLVQSGCDRSFWVVAKIKSSTTPSPSCWSASAHTPTTL